MINGELIVDNFAGGGGASTGIELATGYSVDIAINHDPEAIKMHKAIIRIQSIIAKTCGRLIRSRHAMGIQSDLPGSHRIASTLARRKAENQRIRISVVLLG